jgi:hypothetical protein
MKMPIGVYKHHPNQGMSGKTHSAETRLKISIGHKGRKSHRKMADKILICGFCNKQFTVTESKYYKNRKYCCMKCKTNASIGMASHSKGVKGIFHHTAEAKKKISEASKNMNIESRLKISKAHRGEKSHFWKGGITPINKQMRNSIEYSIWRKTVFVRDNYTCSVCGKVGGYLHAHHIKRLSKFPELSCEITNGVTMCKDCHMIETWGKK